MKTFTLERAVDISQPIDHVFDFFSRAENLERLTPPFLNFKILTPTPVEMKEGALIDYRLSLHGLPLRWRSVISEWDPPHRFVDEQVKGPYRLWHHTHLFEETAEGTRVVDRVKYAVLGGSLVRRFLVAPDLERIFNYRREQLTEIFAS